MMLYLGAPLMLIVVTVLTLHTFNPSFAEKFFDSTKKLNPDARIVRSNAMNTGGKVGGTDSPAVATIVPGQVGPVSPKHR